LPVFRESLLRARLDTPGEFESPPAVFDSGKAAMDTDGAPIVGRLQADLRDVNRVASLEAGGLPDAADLTPAPLSPARDVGWDFGMGAEAGGEIDDADREKVCSRGIDEIGNIEVEGSVPAAVAAGFAAVDPNAADRVDAVEAKEGSAVPEGLGEGEALPVPSNRFIGMEGRLPDGRYRDPDSGDVAASEPLFAESSFGGIEGEEEFAVEAEERANGVKYQIFLYPSRHRQPDISPAVPGFGTGCLLPGNPDRGLTF